MKPVLDSLRACMEANSRKPVTLQPDDIRELLENWARNDEQYAKLLDAMQSTDSVLTPRPCKCGSEGDWDFKCHNCDCECHLPLALRCQALKAACRTLEGLYQMEKSAREYLQRELKHGLDAKV